MDDVIVDTLEYTIACLNEVNVFVDRTMLAGKFLEDILSNEEIELMHRITGTANFFKNIPIKKDCYDVLKKMNIRHDIRVVSCAFVFPKSMNSKFEWLRKNLDFVDAKQIIFCGSKSDLTGDVLIDDIAENLNNFKGEKYLFSAPHNFGVDRYKRLNSWADIDRILNAE